MLTARFTSGISLAGSNANLSGYADIEDGSALIIDNTVAANNTAETLTGVAFDKTKLRGIYVVSNIACNATFSGTSNPALHLAAGVPYVWHDASNITNPFGNNVTNCRIDNNNATAAAHVQMNIILDPS